mgnify:CR=1 FL=1|jgi:hypothetical protein
MTIVLLLNYMLTLQLSFTKYTITEKEKTAVKPRGYFRYELTYSMKDPEQGQKIHLDGMESIGGRHQEADWLEIAKQMDLNRIMK